jgi:hypothetical protein
MPASRRVSLDQEMTKVVFATETGLARREDLDVRTVKSRARRGQLQPSAFLRRSGKLIALYEIGTTEISESREAELVH